jgi:hypothetical protein
MGFGAPRDQGRVVLRKMGRTRGVKTCHMATRGWCGGCAQHRVVDTRGGELVVGGLEMEVRLSFGTHVFCSVKEPSLKKLPAGSVLTRAPLDLFNVVFVDACTRSRPFDSEGGGGPLECM